MTASMTTQRLLLSSSQIRLQRYRAYGGDNVTRPAKHSLFLPCSLLLFLVNNFIKRVVIFVTIVVEYREGRNTRGDKPLSPVTVLLSPPACEAPVLYRM